MIYKIYERFIEITENYRIWDYLVYIIFLFIILACGLYYTLAYGQGSYVVKSDKLEYTISAEKFTGNLALPPMIISCDNNEDISLMFKVTASNYNTKAILDITVLDGAKNSLANQLTRLKEDNIQTITYSHNIGKPDLKTMFSTLSDNYPYTAERSINLHGQFNKGMELHFIDIQAASLNGKCIINWFVPAH